MHLMANPAFERHQARWTIYQPKIVDPKWADQKIVPAMLLLNKLPGIVTVFSCQGHPTEDHPVVKGHFMLAVTNPKWLYRFYEVLMNKRGVSNQLVNLRLVHKKDSTLPRFIEEWVPMWLVEWHVRLQQAQSNWNDVNEAAVEVFEEYLAGEARFNELCNNLENED